MTKEITLPSGTYIFTEVPNDAYDFHLIHNKTRVAYFIPKYKRFDLPYGENFEIVSTTKDITDREIDKIISKVMNNQHYQNYNYKLIIDRWVKTAKESLNSLIKSLELDINNNYLILKKL